MSEALEMTRQELSEHNKMKARHLLVSVHDVWEALRLAVRAKPSASSLAFVHRDDVRAAVVSLARKTIRELVGINEPARRLGIFNARGSRPVAALPAGVIREISPGTLLKLLRRHSKLQGDERITHFAIEVDGRITYRIEKELN